MIQKQEHISKPKVSIVCIFYNHEEYMRDCLEGILMQNVDFEYEIVAHDDASTDRTVEILREYQTKYPNIFKLILQKENQYSKGVQILTEFIAPKLRGEYVAICEGDDFWTDCNKLQRQIDFLERHQEYVACVHNSEKWNLLEGKKERMYTCDSDYDITFEQVCKGGGVAYQTASIVFRRIYLENLPRFFTMVTRFFDYTLSMHLALSGKIRFINEIMSVYRFFSKGSLAEKSITELKDTMIKYYEINCSMLKEVDKYSEHKYHSTLQPIIENYQYNIALEKNDYKVLSREPHKARFSKECMQYRLKIFFKYYFNDVYELYKKIRY